jgi:pectate lyase
MRQHTPWARLSAAMIVAGSLLVPTPATAAPHGHTAVNRAPLERQVLARNDGWASLGTGTTGGSAATAQHVYDVRTRAELLAAFAEAGTQPKIIRVHGDLEANVDPTNRPLTCTDYAAGTGFSLAQYLKDFDPATYGRDTEPAGPQEDARQRAAARQAAVIRWDIPSNTTIVGANPRSSITGAALRINGATNVIVRNLTLRDAADCFPSWDPTDGDEGNWNSEYDLLQVINGATHVWVDHSTFTDAPNTDETQPSYFGRPFQVHDGAVDVTNGSDLVTMSHNRFADHDKLLLIGSTDSPTRGDPGKLRVTIHHNLFVDVGQRAPRVRYGHVDLYNNHFVIRQHSTIEYVYSLGVGVESHLYAEANAFSVSRGIPTASIIHAYGGTTVATLRNTVNGHRVDLLAAYNNHVPAEEQLTPDTSWTPTLRRQVTAARAVPAQVDRSAGPNLRTGR